MELGFINISENDYVRSSFRKEKRVLSIIKNPIKYEEALTLLGTSWELPEEVFAEILKTFVQFMVPAKKILMKRGLILSLRRAASRC